MKKQINKLSIINRIALLAILLIAVANPWVAGYLGYWIELLATYFVLYSIYAFVAGLVVLTGVTIYFMWNSRDQVNIPKGNSKRPKEIR